MTHAIDSAAGRGREATAPIHVDAHGWKDVLGRVRVEVKRDRVPLLAAGVAFFTLLALVPGLAALISIYGLVGDPATVQERVTDLMGAAPTEARELVASQARSILEQSGSATGIGLVVSILLALWSTSSGMQHLVEAVNLAYDEDETRGFLKLRAVSLAMTLGALAFLILAVVAIAALPALMARWDAPDAVRLLVGILRWPFLAGLLLAALALLYRFGPDRDQPRWAWVSPGGSSARCCSPSTRRTSASTTRPTDRSARS
jgi:membrane protein